jgi:hypothetical protein
VLLTTAGLQVPVIPLLDVVGKPGTDWPVQILVLLPKLKLGVIFGFTVTEKVVPRTQPGVLGVNTYTPELVGFTTAGLQVPEMPFNDVLGKTGTVPVSQITSEVPNANTGVTLGVTVMVTVTGKAHALDAGVNVYVPVAVLLTTAGLQVPEIPLLDTPGKVGGVVPSQKGGNELKEGTNMGSDKMTPVKTSVVVPPRSKMKLVYKPLLKPGIVTCPVALAVIVIGPLRVPFSM